MENNRPLMPKPEVIEAPSPFDQDTCAIEVNDEAKKSSSPSPAKVVGYIPEVVQERDVSSLPPDFADDITEKTKNDMARPAAGPEVLGCDIEAPAPDVSMQTNANVGFLSKLMQSSRMNNDLQKVAPGETGPVVEKTRDSHSSSHYSSTIDNDRFIVKSHHSSGKELSLSEKGLAVACPVTDDEKPVCVASEYDPSAKTSFYKSTTCHILTALALLLTGAAVAVGVVFGTRKEIEENVIVQSPTMMPITHREARIRQMIEDNVLERNATFIDMKEADSRYLALDWIVNEDRLQLTVTDPNLLQRYILAVLAFSFDLISWECGMVKDLDSCNITDNYGDYSLWLSRTDECAWYGVECDNSGVVTGLDLCKFLRAEISSF
jgi:hypothetical protein